MKGEESLVQRIYLDSDAIAIDMYQFVLTPAAGKRLIAKALAVHPAVLEAMHYHTMVIIAGTTNGYLAEEILLALGQEESFSKNHFFRGITLPPGRTTTEGRLADQSHFPGDVVIEKGIWQKGTTIFDVAAHLKEGDLILKGANALDPVRHQAGVLIGHPQGGTAIAALQAAVGRRVGLIIPVGLEKRITGDLIDLARLANAPSNSGPRILPLPGEVFTEIEAIRLLSGARAEILAAGGVGGAEGAVWLAAGGSPEELLACQREVELVIREENFRI